MIKNSIKISIGVIFIDMTYFCLGAPPMDEEGNIVSILKIKYLNWAFDLKEDIMYYLLMLFNQEYSFKDLLEPKVLK